MTVRSKSPPFLFLGLILLVSLGDVAQAGETASSPALEASGVSSLEGRPCSFVPTLEPAPVAVAGCAVERLLSIINASRSPTNASSSPANVSSSPANASSSPAPRPVVVDDGVPF